MRIEIHNKLGQPQVLEVTRVVIKDKFGNPIAIALEPDDGVIIADIASKGNEIQFNQLLRSLGIQKTVLVHEPTQQPLREIQFD